MPNKNRNLTLNRVTHSFLFFAFVIIGSIVLSLAKVANIPPLMLITISAGLMAAYAFFISVVPATRLRLDIAADNMYYLGFLYTLSSLAVAITVSDPDQVLANFGVAITSTILGIAARVAFNQMRVDPHDIEAASRIELSEATRRVSKELDETIAQLSKFRTMSLQVMAEGYEDVQKNVEKAAKDIFESLKETSEKNTEVLIELGKSSAVEQDKLVQSILTLKGSNDELSSANKKMVEHTITASEALQLMTNKYSNAGVLETKIINEVKEGLGEVQSNLLKEFRSNLAADTSTLEAKLVTGVKENFSKMENSLLNEVRTNLEYSQANLENKVVKELKSTAEDERKLFIKETQLVSEKLQKSIEENSKASNQVLEMKKIIDDEAKSQAKNSLGKKQRRWFRRK